MKYSALHYACSEGNTECIALLGRDRRMTKDILNAVNEQGKTALMLAVELGHLSSVEEMAKLEGVDWKTANEDGESLEDVARNMYHEEVLEYLEQENFGSARPIKPKYKKLKEIALNIFALDENLETENTTMFMKHAKEKEDLKEKQATDIAVLEMQQRKEVEDMARKHNVKHQVLVFYTTSVPPTTPDCPVCLEAMAPPCKIFTCPNGHLECGQCKEKVATCSICTEPVMGRASAVEQLLRTMYKIQ